MTRNDRSDALGREESAISPVVGIALLVVVVIGLSSVAVVLFTGLAGNQPDQSAAVAAEVEWKAGNDSTFANPGNGGPCAGPDASPLNDDRVEITFDAADPVNMSNVEIQMGTERGVTNVTAPACGGGGNVILNWLETPPDKIAAGRTLVIYEGYDNNPIRPGAELTIIWNDPDSKKSHVIYEQEVPDR